MTDRDIITDGHIALLEVLLENREARLTERDRYALHLSSEYMRLREMEAAARLGGNGGSHVER